MENKETKYIKYLIKLIELDFCHLKKSERKNSIINILNKIKYSENLLKEIFLISKIKKFRNLSAYLLFILKKSSEEKINFDNLIENINTDKTYLKNELLKEISEDEIYAENVINITEKNEKHNFEQVKKEWKTDIITEETLETEFLEKETGIKPEKGLNIFRISREVTDSYKEKDEYESSVNMDDEDYITEQHEKTDKQSEYIRPEVNILNDENNLTDLEKNNFEDKTVFDTEKTFIDESLELLQEKNNAEVENIYMHPDETESKENENKNKETDKIKNDAFSIPVPKIPEIEKMEDNSEIKDENNEQLKKTESTKEKLKRLFHMKSKKEEEIKEDRKKEENIFIKGVTEKDTENTSLENSANDNEFLKKDTDKPSKKIYIDSTTNDYTDETDFNYGKKPDKETSSVTEEEENKLFKNYEKILREKNLIISESLINLREDYEIGKENSLSGDDIKRIIAECDYMEKYSLNMRFELISKIYSTIKIIINEYQNKNLYPDSELYNLLINGIILIHKLITGDDISSYENTLENIEAKREKIIFEKEEKEKAEKRRKEKEQAEKELSEKYKETHQRKKLLDLKNKILNIEKVFKSLDTMKEEFQTYEAYRILSKTYEDFKTIVNLSNELKIANMAKLSEGGYIFIKYIQNYRIDPKSEDVKEVLNYIIVNYKLLFLGKTPKDIETFLTYLLNPENIFTDKK